MVKKYLVTTADEPTWVEGQDVIFLGEWCKRFSRRKKWKKLNAKTAKYHWDDREKFSNDFIYLNSIYEELLLELSTILNEYHGIDKDLRFWRIIIGTWLGYFIQTVFDRWYMIGQSINEHNLTHLIARKEDLKNLAPKDMQEFLNLYLKDNWNESICLQIIKRDFKELTIVYLDETNKQSTEDDQSLIIKKNFFLTLRRKITASILRLINFSNILFTRRNDIFLLSTYLPRASLLSLYIKIGEFPKFWKKVLIPKEINFSFRERDFRWRNKDSKDKFKSLVQELIQNNIPLSYLEGYKEIDNFVSKLPWPKEPKSIFTSSAFIDDDVFKIWSAKKVSEDSSMILGQHGGDFGSNALSFDEKHQLEISDRFISWGWSRKNNSKIVPVGNFKIRNKKIKANNKGPLLLVQNTVPRYSYRLFSAPIAGQWLSYFNDQKRFVSLTSQEIQNRLIIRLTRNDEGWDQLLRWQEFYPHLSIDNGIKPIIKAYKRSRLVVTTNNGTTHLESMALGIPTIIFWNPKYWELSKDALLYYEKLKSVGIFHETPESAAKKTLEVWSDVQSWWNDKEVIKIKKEFLRNYSDTSDNLIKSLAKALSTK